MMRWRTGFVRVWIIVSAVWCAIVAGYAYIEYSNAPSLRTLKEPPPSECRDRSEEIIPLSCVEYDLKQQEATTALANQSKPAWVYLLVAIGPPIALLVLGMVLG
jgi:hypothetical protein